MPVAEAADPLESRSLESIAPVEETAGVEPDDQGLENVGAEQTDEAPSSLSDGNEPAEPEVPQTPSFVERLAQYGMPVPEGVDEDTAIQQMVQAARERAFYQQQYLRAQQEMQQYQRQQPVQQPQAPQVAPPAEEFDTELLKMVKRDPETGQIVPINAYIDPSIPGKVTKYLKQVEERRAKWEKLDPEEFQRKTIEEAESRAEAKWQERWTQQQQQAVVQQTLAQNQDWLYQRDAAGNFFSGPNGNRVLSPLGVQFAQAVQFVESQGVTDPQAQAYMAQAILRDSMQAQAQQQPQQQQTQAQLTPQQQFLNKSKAATGGRPRGTQVANSLANGNPPPQNPSLDFKQMLERKFDEAGFR